MKAEKVQLAASIVEFLQDTIDKKDVTGDDSESLVVAIDCIKDAFDLGDTRSKDDLLNIFVNRGNASAPKSAPKPAPAGASNATPSPATPKPATPKASSNNSGSSTTSTSTNTSSTNAGSSASKPSASSAPKASSADDKKRAEEFKVEGNRKIAQKKFDEAVEYYTKAIELDDSNAIYYSNRSAAYSSLKKPKNAAEDAEKAIELDPNYSKAYSRLGLARYSMGDAEGAMEAYKKGLDVEGSSPSDGMLRGFETAKKKVEENLAAANADSSDIDPSGTATTGGLPDFASLLNNPQMGDIIQNLASNPSMISEAMNNPQIRQYVNQFTEGSGRSLQDLFSNPALLQMASSFMSNMGRG